MGIYTRSNGIYSQPPLSLNDGRDETFIIDVLGTWVPECEIIFYGLLGTPYAESLYKLREMVSYDPKQIYHEYAFFTSRDLIRYLSSVDDELDMEISEEEIEDAINLAFRNYMYIPCSETMIRHSIMEIMYDRFVKSVTLVFPWDLRPIDVAHLRHITPEKIADKLVLTSGTIPSVIEETDATYTTVISNSIEDINLMVDERKKYHTESTLFLLRNHSQNMSIIRNEDGSVEFVEDHMDELIPKLIDLKTGFPKTRNEFGRFEPQLFSDMEPRFKGFNDA